MQNSEPISIIKFLNKFGVSVSAMSEILNDNWHFFQPEGKSFKQILEGENLKYIALNFDKEDLLDGHSIGGAVSWHYEFIVHFAEGLFLMELGDKKGEEVTIFIFRFEESNIDELIECMSICINDYKEEIDHMFELTTKFQFQIEQLNSLKNLEGK